MSTFDGCVAEFPDIRIDYFRQTRGPQTRLPLAYFLSHVHTDHTVGLESCNSPFVYCSKATREILLRLEKYPHRMNFAKGILETRKQTFRPQSKLLKAIPLETPTEIELAPGNSIRVTLFDANHCVGAVMFLIEGNGNAILYTGDIRSEGWWVNGLTRNPLLLPYVATADRPPIKKLDCIYLDTTFVAGGKEDPYKQFPSKAEGVTELLAKVAKYPKDTFFYFDSWTFGYEDVWKALSAFIDSQIHVDDYRFGLYRSLANAKDITAPEAASLVGFYCGNHFQQGCLTQQQTRLHSCEYGTGCEIFDKEFVRITPIITRHDGVELMELGAGGGQGDLDQRHELDVGDNAVVGQLIGLCAKQLHDKPKKLEKVFKLLSSIIQGQAQSLSLGATLFSDDTSQIDEDLISSDEFPLEKLAHALGELVSKPNAESVREDTKHSTKKTTMRTRSDGLPKRITFPYSRHSSYVELCLLVEAFEPKDIFPCTVDSANWTPASAMSFLFGHVYPDNPVFRHDQTMLKRKTIPRTMPAPQLPADDTLSSLASSPCNRKRKHETEKFNKIDSVSSDAPDEISEHDKPAAEVADSDVVGDDDDIPDGHDTIMDYEDIRLAFRKEVQELVMDSNGSRWAEVVLVSTGGHSSREEEL